MSYMWSTIYKFMWDTHKADCLKNKPRDEQNHWRLHPEVKKWRSRKEYKKNKSKYISRSKIYYRDNIEAKRLYGREHYRKNSEAYAVRARGRKKAMKLSSDGKSSIFYKFRDILNAAHGKVVYHVDHIIPLSRGGKHICGNFAIATADYNQWKRASIVDNPSSYFGSSQVK